MVASDAMMETEEVEMVFNLIDAKHYGHISEAALAQALLSTSLVDEGQARTKAADAVRDGRQVDVKVFRAALEEAVEEAQRALLEGTSSSKRTAAAPSMGSACLGVLEDLRKFYGSTNRSANFKMADAAKKMHDQLSMREELRRMRDISLRQESEHQGVQEAQMMQAMEFNSAWSQNMTEFERQAREILEGAIRRHQEEFVAFQAKLREQEPHAYKFSKELIDLRTNVDRLAKQKKYDEALRIKTKADQLEKWERMKLDNEFKTMVANKELQLRQQQQTQMDALRRRIQRGREEHKEHWLMGAQRLMQSHRNMLSDLKSKQSLENQRADVAVKLDMTAGKAEVVRRKISNHFADTLPRVDCGQGRSSSHKKLTLMQIPSGAATR
uniref:EF-hand domain-containing protein n=1 Tax=Haptolina brevifila TaxID=156173 RepID=A0A7S2GZT4_9EUKA